MRLRWVPVILAALRRWQSGTAGRSVHTITVAATTPPTNISAPGLAPWVMITFAVIGLLSAIGLGSGGWALARTRHQPPDESASFERLLEAGRRMTRAVDRRETARIAIEEAMALVSATKGAFVAVERERLSVLHDPDSLLQADRLASGALRQVVDTGRSSVQICREEPGLQALPCSLLAVPIIGSGQVVGVMLLVRGDDRPFSADDETVVGRLAPMVGSALVAAAQLDGATEGAQVDALTGLANRRRLDSDLAQELAAATRTSEATQLAVAMIDVDHFKHFNDRNGHAAGDLALRAVADAMRASVRSGDTAYRYGGEEFSLILRDVDQLTAEEIAERVRAAVQAAEITGSGAQPAGYLSVSIGLAVGALDDPSRAIALADQALYRAKEDGRNRVVVSDRS